MLLGSCFIHICILPFSMGASQVALVLKNLQASAGDIRNSGLIPGSGRSSGGWYGYPLLYSCLENPMDRGAWWARVHEVTESWTRLKGLSMHTCTLPNITALVPLDQSQP